jgi:membrane protein insertase Oxa1/YidC/SpoIIIJ
MGFVQIVYRPITFILRIPKATIAAAATELGLESALFTSNQLKVFSYPELLEKLGISSSSLNFNFLGIDLTKVLQQNMSDWKMWILPVLALIFSILSTYVSQRQATKNQNANAKNDPSQAQAAAMTKSMYVMMPLMTIWITFSWPLGCALYWIISTVTQIAQQMFINKFIVSKMDKIDITGKKKKKKKTQVVKDAEIIKDTTQKGENNSEAD